MISDVVWTVSKRWRLFAVCHHGVSDKRAAQISLLNPREGNNIFRRNVITILPKYIKRPLKRH